MFNSTQILHHGKVRHYLWKGNSYLPSIWKTDEGQTESLAVRNKTSCVACSLRGTGLTRNAEPIYGTVCWSSDFSEGKRHNIWCIVCINQIQIYHIDLSLAKEEDELTLCAQKLISLVLKESTSTTSIKKNYLTICHKMHQRNVFYCV